MAAVADAKLDQRGDVVETIKAVGEDLLEVNVDGKTVRVVSRPADDDRQIRLFELDLSPADTTDAPLSDDDVASVVRGLIDGATERGQRPEVIGVSPGAALAFPDDPRISVRPVQPVSFSLPSSPAGLILEMDERGDGHLSALATGRVRLGSEGMWWIVTRLIDALEMPEIVALWPRFLTVGGALGGSATQASMEVGESGELRLVWRRLDSGVVGETLALHELSPQRVSGWLSILVPVRDQLERQRVHRQRMRAAKTAEKWARALERWSN
jgi:hypothetical protein